MVRGWWSAIVLSFLSFAVVRGWWSAIVLSFAVVRGWWSAIVLSCWWSILHEFFRRTLSRSFREKTIALSFGNPISHNNSQGTLMKVSRDHKMTVRSTEPQKGHFLASTSPKKSTGFPSQVNNEILQFIFLGYIVHLAEIS